MARSIEELKKQYNSVSHGMSLRGGGPGGRHGVKTKGKPQNIGKTVKRILSYVGKYKLRLIMVYVCMLLTTVSALCAGYLIAPIINRITLAVKPDAVLEPSALEIFADGIIESFVSTPLISSLMTNTAAEVTVYVFAALIILATVYGISAFGSYIQGRLMLSVSLNSIKTIRDDLFKALQRLPVRYFDSHPTGEIMSRFTNDVDNIDVMLNNSLTSIVSGVISLVGTFIFMLTTNIWLTLVTVLFLPLLMFAAGTIAKNSSKYYGAQQAALGAVNGYIEETISGQKVVKVFNHEDECIEEMELINEDLREKQEKAQFWGGVMGPIMGNTSQISYALTAGIGGLLCLAGRFDVGGLVVFVNYSRQFSMPINMISGQMATIFSALAHANINIKMIDQGSSELNIIIGVGNDDFEKAIKAIYDIFVETRL